MTEPRERVHLTAQNLKGIAHPIRVRLLNLLRVEGPSTATKLAEKIGQSSGVTSYHLRQLALHGFVEEDPELGNARERWWRSAHRSTSLEAPAAREAPMETEIFMRAVAMSSAEVVDRWLGEMASIPDAWDRAGGLNDYRLRLTAQEATELFAKLDELIQSARIHYAPDAPADAEEVVVQLNMLPFIRRGDGATDDGSE